MSNISVYADQVNVDLDDSQVHLEGVDVGQVVAEFYAGDVLDALEFSDIIDYVQRVREEDADE